MDTPYDKAFTQATENIYLKVREILPKKFSSEFLDLIKNYPPTNEQEAYEKMYDLFLCVMITFVCEQVKEFAIHTKTPFTDLANNLSDLLPKAFSILIHNLNECENCKETNIH